MIQCAPPIPPRVCVYAPAVEVVRANGLEIAYERVGEGPPLVFVHGAAEDGRVWRPQLAALADEFTVVAWDEPGAGRSSDVPADFGLAGLRELPRGADRGARARPGARRRPLLGRHRRAGALPPPSRARRDPDPRRYLRRLEGVAARGGGACPGRGRAPDARGAAEEFDPTLPGLFAGDPPAEFVPLLERDRRRRPPREPRGRSCS